MTTTQPLHAAGGPCCRNMWLGVQPSRRLASCRSVSVVVAVAAKEDGGVRCQEELECDLEPASSLDAVGRCRHAVERCSEKRGRGPVPLFRAPPLPVPTLPPCVGAACKHTREAAITCQIHAAGFRSAQSRRPDQDDQSIRDPSGLFCRRLIRTDSLIAAGAHNAVLPCGSVRKRAFEAWSRLRRFAYPVFLPLNLPPLRCAVPIFRAPWPHFV